MYKLDFQELKLKETASLDSIVDQMTLFIHFQGDRYYYIVNLPEPDPLNYTPIENITDELLEQWFWENVDRETVNGIFVEREKRKASSATKQQVNGDKKYKVKDHIKQWKPDKVYEEGSVVFYEWEEERDTGEVKEDGTPITEKVKHKEFFKALQTHTSVVDKTPLVTTNLFESADKFTPEGEIKEYPQWVLPTDTSEAYAKNRIVSHNAKLWQSEKDANMDEPPTGWKEYKKAVVYETWKDKLSYVSGDIVEYNGTNYIALEDHTSVKGEEPDVNTVQWSVYTGN